jgi:hypothetical protein
MALDMPYATLEMGYIEDMFERYMLESPGFSLMSPVAGRTENAPKISEEWVV